MRTPPVYKPTPVADLPLFAHARTTDPQTSKDAAQKVNAAELEARVLAVLRIAPEGKTSHEVAAIIGRPLVSVSPRMKPLESRGLVVRDGRRDGRTVWKAVDAAA